MQHAEEGEHVALAHLTVAGVPRGEDAGATAAQTSPEPCEE